MYYCEHKWKVKTGEAWEQGLRKVTVITTVGVSTKVPSLKGKYYHLLVISVTSAFEMVLLQVTKDLQMKKYNPQNCRKEIAEN